MDIYRAYNNPGPGDDDDLKPGEEIYLDDRDMGEVATTDLGGVGWDTGPTGQTND